MKGKGSYLEKVGESDNSKENSCGHYRQVNKTPAGKEAAHKASHSVQF